MELSVLGIYNSVTEANLVRAKLESAGIEAAVESDVAGSMVPPLAFTEGVKVLVRSSDLAEAMEVLERMLPPGE